MHTVNIGENLRIFIEKNFKNQTEFAKIISMSIQSLHKYLTNQRKPGAEILSKLAKIGCDINWLLTNVSETDESYIPNIEPSYITIDEAEQNFVPPTLSFPILGSIPAGIAEIVDYERFEYYDFDFDPKTHGMLKIDEEFGYSMMPFIGPGDICIISYYEKPQNGDWVAARWDETKGALKELAIDEEDPSKVVLISYNPSVRPIVKDSNKVKLWKVPIIIRVSKRR